MKVNTKPFLLPKLYRMIGLLSIILFGGGYAIQARLSGTGILDILWKTIVISVAYSISSVFFCSEQIKRISMPIYMTGCGLLLLAQLCSWNRVLSLSPLLLPLWAVSVSGNHDRLSVLSWSLPLLLVSVLLVDWALLPLVLLSVGLLLFHISDNQSRLNIVLNVVAFVAVGAGLIIALIAYVTSLNALTGASVCVLCACLFAETSICGLWDKKNIVLPLVASISATVLLHTITMIGGQLPWLRLNYLTSTAISMGLLLENEEEELPEQESP